MCDGHAAVKVAYNCPIMMILIIYHMLKFCWTLCLYRIPVTLEVIPEFCAGNIPEFVGSYWEFLKFSPNFRIFRSVSYKMLQSVIWAEYQKFLFFDIWFRFCFFSKWKCLSVKESKPNVWLDILCLFFFFLWQAGPSNVQYIFFTFLYLKKSFFWPRIFQSKCNFFP